MSQETSAAGAGFAFVSSVPAKARARVERLFYFNPRQAGLHAQIRRVVEETGSPYIEERELRITIEVPGGGTQCLFACTQAERPVGVALYSRPSSQTIRILHLAVDAAAGRRRGGDGRVAVAMVEQIRAIAGRVRGVERVQLPYRSGAFLRVLKSR